MKQFIMQDTAAAKMVCRPLAFVRTALSLFLLTCAIAAAVCVPGPAVFAQSKDAPAPDSKPAPAKDAPAKDSAAEKADNPQEVAALFDALDDMGELRVLTPLKLTPEALDKMTAAIAASQTDYNKKLGTLVAPSIRKVADNIRSAKKQALAGKELTSDDTILKAMTEYTAKRKELDDATLKTLSAKLQDILTEDQVKAAAKVARDEQAKMDEQAKPNSPAKKGTDAQWFNLYVLRVVMGYPRIVPLLKEMKTAQASAASDKTTAAASGDGKAP